MLLALTKASSVIRLESHHLNIFSTEDGEKHTIPLPLIERVVLTDAPRISGAVMQELLLRKIPVTFVSGKGEFLGQLHFTPGGESERRKQQYQMSEESNFLPAYKLLEAKLYNQKRLLLRLSVSHHLETPKCLDIARLLRSLKRQTSSDSLKGVEGMAAHFYFKGLRRFLPAWCRFAGRVVNPPRDPVNALLSYSFVGKNIFDVF